MKSMVQKKIGMGVFSVWALVSMSLFVAACSSSAEKSIAGGTTEDAGIVAITDRVVSGVSQKGPFLVGTSVTIQELDGQTLDQTGKSFKSSIKNDKGEFTVKGVNLVSQYALLEVNGYYRNEVTGQKSGGMIILNALTNLQSRDHVNVNLVTHLATGRILKLVQEEGKSFSDAKKQAEQEVLASFGITASMGSSEDLDLFTGEGGAALLAISVLMQGDVSEADFSERIALAAMSFADSGVWAGADKAEVADWAFNVYARFQGSTSAQGINVLAEARNYVESWNDGDSVPPFEKYIYNFWVNEYGLGSCSEKNLYAIQTNTNKMSKYYKYEFSCYKEGWELVRVTRGDDGYLYRSFKEDKYLWSAENLRKTNTSKGTCYDLEKSNCETYGALFKRDEAISACPDESSLPTFKDVQRLLNKYGGDGKKVAKELRAEDGFHALNGGWYDGNEFVGKDEMAVFWLRSWGFEKKGFFFLKIDSKGARIEFMEEDENVVVQASVRCLGDDRIDDSESESIDETMVYRDRRSKWGDEFYDLVDIEGNIWMATDMAYYFYESDDNLIYPWDEAKRACPEGWHLPSRQEWNDLLMLVADSSRGIKEGETEYYGVDYKLMGDANDWIDDYYQGDYDGIGNIADFAFVGPHNLYGFNVHPYLYDRSHAFFWTSSDATEEDKSAESATHAYAVSIGLDSVKIVLHDKQTQNAVRCIKG